MRTLIFACALVMLSGCVDSRGFSVRLGDVSYGQQLIDLKKAYEQQAITENEYHDLKARLIAAADMCGENEESEQSSWDWF